MFTLKKAVEVYVQQLFSEVYNDDWRVIIFGIFSQFSLKDNVWFGKNRYISNKKSSILGMHLKKNLFRTIRTCLPSLFCTASMVSTSATTGSIERQRSVSGQFAFPDSSQEYKRPRQPKNSEDKNKY